MEGLCKGIDEDLVRSLGEWVTLPCTYAGGAKGERAGQAGDDLTHRPQIYWTSILWTAYREARWISLSARKSTRHPHIISLIICRSLDIFGGTGVKFDELVEADKKAKAASSS